MGAEPNRPDWKEERIREMTRLLDALVNAPGLRFDENLCSALSEEHGIYTISVLGAGAGEFLRAGRTKSPTGGLRQRIYQNHFMGSQNGNLRMQLTHDGVCQFEQTKQWIRENCLVRFLVIEDRQTRIWAEHLMLAILKPKYCD